MSAHAAGIPKPTHSSPSVPELIALSEVLPMMGIAFWCVWAAYTTTEPPEVSVVSTYQLSACPFTAIETVCEALFCPVTAMDAVCDLLPCSEPAMEACYEVLSCPDPTEEATSELSASSASLEDAGCEISDCFAAPIVAICESSSLPVMAMDALSVSVFPRSQSLPWSSGPSLRSICHESGL